MGEEYKALLDKSCELEEKNKGLEQKIKLFEKNNGSQTAGNVDNDWETISNPNSEPEVIIESTSRKTSSSTYNESIEYLLKKVLKKS